MKQSSDNEQGLAVGGIEGFFLFSFISKNMSKSSLSSFHSQLPSSLMQCCHSALT